MTSDTTGGVDKVVDGVLEELKEVTGGTSDTTREVLAAAAVVFF